MNPHACHLRNRFSTMRIYAICTALALVTSAASFAHADNDPWFGKDKAAHFGASALISAAGYGVGVAAFGTRIDGLAIGGSTGLTVGLGKEVYDAAGHGTVSGRDFTWDAIGTATGLLLALTVDWLVRGNIPCFGATCLSSKASPPVRESGFGSKWQEARVRGRENCGSDYGMSRIIYHTP